MNCHIYLETYFSERNSQSQAASKKNFHQSPPASPAPGTGKGGHSVNPLRRKKQISRTNDLCTSPRIANPNPSSSSIPSASCEFRAGTGHAIHVHCLPTRKMNWKRSARFSHLSVCRRRLKNIMRRWWKRENEYVNEVKLKGSVGSFALRVGTLRQST